MTENEIPKQEAIGIVPEPPQAEAQRSLWQETKEKRKKILTGFTKNQRFLLWGFIIVILYILLYGLFGPQDPMQDVVYCNHRAPVMDVVNETGSVVAWKVGDCLVQDTLRIRKGCFVEHKASGDEINCKALEAEQKQVRWEDLE